MYIYMIIELDKYMIHNMFLRQGPPLKCRSTSPVPSGRRPGEGVRLPKGDVQRSQQRGPHGQGQGLSWMVFQMVNHR